MIQSLNMRCVCVRARVRVTASVCVCVCVCNRFIICTFFFQLFHYKTMTFPHFMVLLISFVSTLLTHTVSSAVFYRWQIRNIESVAMHYHDIPAFITICCISDHARFHHCLFIEHRRVRSYNKTPLHCTVSPVFHFI
jgi:hypothetical protein